MGATGGQGAVRLDKVWRNARLATLAPGRPGLGVVERGAVALSGGRIAYAGQCRGGDRLRKALDHAGSGRLPVVPEQGSVGASGDLAPLAHMAAAMIGVGEVFVAGGARVSAAAALREAGLR